MTDEQHRIGAHDEASARSRRFQVSTASVVVVLGIAAVVALFFMDDRSAIAPVDTSDAADIVESDDATPTEPPTPNAPVALPSRAPLAFDLDFSALGMLAEIPSEGVSAGRGLIVSGTDLARISVSAGVERAGFVDLSQPPSPWIETLFLEQAFALTDSDVFSQSVQDPVPFEAELGFTFLDIDRFVTATNFLGFEASDELALPFESVVLRSDLDELVARAGEDRIIDVGAGVDGEQIVEERTSLRPFGQPLRVGVAEDAPLVGVSSSTSYVETWLNASSVKLVQAPDLAEAGAVLDTDPELYGAHVEQFARSFDDINPGSLLDLIEDDFPIVEEFTTIGMGWSGTGAEQQTSIVYVFGDEAAAAASLEPISGLFGLAPEITAAFSLDEVTVVGRSVLARGNTPSDVSPDEIRRVLQSFSPASVHR